MVAIFPFVIIAILILLNGMFVAAEFAIIGVRPTRIEQLAQEGNATARRLRTILNNPAQVDRYIASAQLGITLASLGLGMYGEPVIAHLIEGPMQNWFGIEGDLLHAISFFIALTLITYLHVVIGEMVPKSLALQNAERTIFMLATPMILMQFIFAYPITVLNKIGVLVLRLLRVPPPSKGSRLHSADELELIVSESVVGGLVETNEATMIRSIFDFSELRVRQIMTPRIRIDAIPLESSHQQLMEKLFVSTHTRLPVYENDPDHIVGVIHLKDVVHQELEGAAFDLRAMLHEVPFVPESMAASELLQQLKQQHVQLAIVIDEYGGTAGLVTFEDLIEEITGEIRDEFDTAETPPLTLIEPGHLRLHGAVRLDEITDYVPLAADFPEVESVGGLVLHLMNAPPQVGDEVKIKEVRLRVEEVQGLSIETVSLYYPAEAPQSES